MSPHFLFLYALYLERLQNKSDICHVLCEELFIRPKGKNLAEGATDYRRDGTSQHCEKKLGNDSESGSRGSLYQLKKQNTPKSAKKTLKS